MKVRIFYGQVDNVDQRAALQREVETFLAKYVKLPVSMQSSSTSVPIPIDKEGGRTIYNVETYTTITLFYEGKTNGPTS